MKTGAILAALPYASAFPMVLEAIQQQGIHERGALLSQKRADVEDREPLFLSNRQNTGVLPPAGFNAAEQLVDVSQGSGHEWVAPGPSDARGQCPGLNAAANHGFLPHDGLPNIQQTVQGLAEAYNMAVDLSSFLAVVSIALAGDFVSTRWSIGGEFPSTVPGLGTPTGILGTHNRYEGDSSPVRGDAYLNGGEQVFQMRQWERMFFRGETYTMDNLAAAQSDYSTRWSIANNPYAFYGPFAGLVPAAAHNFIINFMSNRSAENPGGVLDRNVLKQFFSVTSDTDEPGSFTHTPGHERIPEAWYKRPLANAYTIHLVNADTLINNLMFPGILRFGGNTGTVNSFVGVDTEDVTGGVMNGQTLLEGDNLSCFMLQAAQSAILDQASPIVSGLATFLTSNIKPLQSALSCPELSTFNTDLWNKFPQNPAKSNGNGGLLGGGLLGGLGCDGNE